LASAGALIAVHYGQSKIAADATLAAIKAAGGDGFLVQGDVGAMAGIDQLFKELDVALAERGIQGFDILVNNAGVGAVGDVTATIEADFDKLFAVNVKGVLFVTQCAVPRLRDGGRIINLSSMVSHNAYPDFIAYAASKAAVDSMTLSLAAGLGSRKITVNAVAPGATKTDFIGDLDESFMNAIKSATALGEIGQPEDIADVVAFLASDAGRWVTGERIRASGGMHL
jgi:NAD(P)-dependent dehydrogenase (short-subunit alcohol dehydrogenase family)